MIKSLYVHIPFCLKKCLYCDFNSYTNSNLQYDYIKALEKELLSIDKKNFETIFIGGGTPTILSVQNLRHLLKLLVKFNAKEFTVECNPGTLTKEKLELMKEFGVNRLSIGLQAWQDTHLKTLGRIHSREQFLDNFNLARQIGFQNINIDLMFGIPNQTIQDWRETLDQVLQLKPEHLSCYGLIVEEGTPFHELYEAGTYSLMEEELEREMYYQTVDLLEQHGFTHYEISNFALEGFECKHNMTYWRNEEYIGIGAGAHSFQSHFRFSNALRVEDYIARAESGATALIVERIPVSLEDEMAEYMFLGLRMLEGVRGKDFSDRFGVQLSSVYGSELRELQQLQLLHVAEDGYALTAKGIDLSNQVFIRFLK